MTNEEFRYWISGYFVLSTEDFLSEKQALIIKNHANLVKAVTGKVESNIEVFLENIEKNIQQGHRISASYLKELLLIE